MSKGTLFVVHAVLLAALTLTLGASPLDSSTPPDNDELTCGTKLTSEEYAALIKKDLGPSLIVPPGSPASPPYCVPIAIHVVRRDDGTGGISMSQLEQGLVDINNHELYVNTGITCYYLPDIDYIDDTFYYQNMTTGSHFDDLRAINPVANAINVYFVNQGEIDGFGLCGLSSFTTSSVQGIVMINGCTGVASNPSSYPHEVGHYFDLLHTHQRRDTGVEEVDYEYVDGSNCATAGDLLCDTPADPGLTNKVNSSCVYTGTDTDPHGDAYVPDPYQLMSYSRKLCRTDVTPEGETRALNTLLNERPELLRCPPVADCGGPYVAECTSTPAPGWTFVQLDGTGSSDPDGDAISYLWSGASFDDATSATPTAEFEVGTTPVRLIVSDGELLDTCDVDVTVVDTTPPSLTCPTDITVECVDYCGVPKDDPQLTAFFDSFDATDVCCDPDVTLENDAPDCFPSGCMGSGATTVTFTATDCNGNWDQCTATVTVEDTTPPEISVSVTPEYLWPPNHKLVAISATVGVSDICDSNPQWVLESITSSEPDDGKGDGHTEGDIAEADTGTADVEFMLRSERMGMGEGRTYTIVYRAWDTCGNAAWDTASVYVPHDQSAVAAAAGGYTDGGIGIDPGAETVVVAILSRQAEYQLKGGRQILETPALDATEISLSTAYVGNTAGVALPIRSWKRDVNGDELVDLVLGYSADDVRAIKAATEATLSQTYTTGVIYDGPVGVHVVGGDETPWLVEDIFALGESIPFDGGDDERKRKWEREFEDEPQIADEQGGEVASYSNGIASIFPNPFNPATTIRFTLADASDVTIAVYDVKGKLVRTLLDRQLSAGDHTTAWDGTDTRGNIVATGVYFARMVAGSFAETRKMVLLK